MWLTLAALGAVAGWFEWRYRVHKRAPKGYTVARDEMVDQTFTEPGIEVAVEASPKDAATTSK